MDKDRRRLILVSNRGPVTFNEDGSVKRPAYVTVLHNGVLVQNTVEVPGTAVECSLGLQDHGNPVRYRNIWFRRL